MRTTYTPTEIATLEALSNTLEHVDDFIRLDVARKCRIPVAEAPGQLKLYADALQIRGIPFAHVHNCCIVGFMAFCLNRPRLATGQQATRDAVLGRFLAAHRVSPLTGDTPPPRTASTPSPTASTPSPTPSSVAVQTPDASPSAAAQPPNSTLSRPRLVVDVDDDDDPSAIPADAPSPSVREHSRDEPASPAASQPPPCVQPEPVAARASPTPESPAKRTRCESSSSNSNACDGDSVCSASSTSENDEASQPSVSADDVDIQRPRHTIIPGSKRIVSLDPRRASIDDMRHFFTSLRNDAALIMRRRAWKSIRDSHPLTRDQLQYFVDDSGVRHSTAAKLVSDTMADSDIDSLVMSNETVDEYFSRVNAAFRRDWCLHVDRGSKQAPRFVDGDNHVQRLINLEMIFKNATADDVQNVCTLLTSVGQQTLDTARCNVDLYHGERTPYDYIEIARDVPLTIGLIIAARLYRSGEFTRVLRTKTRRAWPFIYQNLCNMFAFKRL